MEERRWHQFYDPGTPRSLEVEPLPIPGYLERAAREFGGTTSTIFLNSRLSYRELDDQVKRLATALSELGVQKGTRVAIQMPNLPQAVIAFYAVLALGGVVVMTNPLYMPPEIEHQWNDSGCEVAIVVDFLFEDKLRAMRDRLQVREYVVASIPEYLRFPLNLLAPLKLKQKKPRAYAKVTPGPGIHPFKALVRGTAPSPPTVELSLEDLAVLQYTGGTTGVSKGAMLSHGNLAWNVEQMLSWFVDVQQGREVVMAALPLFHVFGLTVSMNLAVSLASGLVLMPDPRDIAQLVKAIHKHRVTLLPAVPAMFNAINHFPGIDSLDVSSVKACFSGSAPLPEDVQQRFEQLTGGRILEGFGMTETSPVTHVNPMTTTRKIGTVGIPVSNTDARVVDIDTGLVEVPVGQEGELVVKGPQVMSGYLGRPEETAETLREGWLHTGDLATVDEDGYFRIVGRKKDMIIASGCNIYPDEVDRVLMAHDAILESATIGVPDERRGETVKSFVVLAEDQRLTAEEVDAWCRKNLAAYKVPREVEFLDELPKSTVLKILRRELRERELTQRGLSS